MANQVLKADGASADAYVLKSFAGVSEVWVTARVYLTADMLASVGDLGYGPDFLEVLAGPGLSGYMEELFLLPDGSDAAWSGTDATPFGAPLAVGWYDIESHVNGTAREIYVGGSLAYSYTYSADTATEALFGLFFAQPDARQVYYLDDLKIGTTRGGTDIFAEDFEGASPLANFDTTSGDVSIVDDPEVEAPVNTSLATYEWRFAVTKLNLRVLTFLDRLARQKQATYELNKAAVATGVVPSDHPEVYLTQNDGFPLVDEGVRCLLGFRREGGSPPWKIRYAGIIMQVEDNADENAGVAPYTTFTAYDPRQLLYSRPVRAEDGSFPGANGLKFSATPGNEIALTLLERSFDNDGEHHIKVAGGTVETTDEMDISFQQGISVGEAWDQLTDSGNLDIILTAFYDPIGHPSKLVQFNAYSLAGTTRHKAVMAWDKPSRSLVGINRLKDGTQRANRIRYYAGQSGAPAGTESDFDSVTQYGDYWTQQFFPGEIVEAAELLAQEQLLLRSKGSRTYKVNPAAGSLGQVDSPILFRDYFLGDTVPIYASSRLRHEIAVGKRVVSIPVVIDDDGRERIEQLEMGEGETEVS